jgi:hypothetical protein
LAVPEASTGEIQGVFSIWPGVSNNCLSGLIITTTLLLTANELSKPDFDSSFDSNIQRMQGNEEEHRGMQKTFVLT